MWASEGCPKCRWIVLAIAGVAGLWAIVLRVPGSAALLVIPVFLLSIGYGVLPAVIAATGFSLAEVLWGEGGDSEWLLAFLLALVAGALIRRAGPGHVRTQRLEPREIDRLIDATGALSAMETQHDLLVALPELLAGHGAAHVVVLAPAEDDQGLFVVAASGVDPGRIGKLPWTSVTGRAFKEARTIYLDNVHADSGYVAVGEAIKSELAIPLRGRYGSRAVLDLEQGWTLSPELLGRYRQFAEVVERVLRGIDERRVVAWTSGLVRVLSGAPDIDTASSRLLDKVTEELPVAFGWLALFRAGRFVVYGVPRDGEGLRPKRFESRSMVGSGFVWEAYTQGRPKLGLLEPAWGLDEVKAGSLGLAQPVMVGRRARAVLLFADWSGLVQSMEWRTLVEKAADLFSMALPRLLAHERVVALLSLEHVSGVAEGELFQQLLDAAIAHVPGAEGGSLLVREEDGRFRYRAAVGYDLQGLSGVAEDQQEQLRWYAMGEEGYRSCTPRVLKGAAVYEGSDFQGASRQAGRVEAIQANLYLPLGEGGEVLGAMNLDSFSDSEAFSEDSFDALELFSVQFSSIIRKAYLRRSLSKAADTDSLTGLLNRRQFDVVLQEALRRYQADGDAFSVSLIDLRQFKRVNDRFGHAKGDEVLAGVARAISVSLRANDFVFRWGGDEFAAIQPGAGYKQTFAVAERVERMISEISVGDTRLGANIGIAACPKDGESAGLLVKVADERMYQAKVMGVSCVSPLSL